MHGEPSSNQGQERVSLDSLEFPPEVEEKIDRVVSSWPVPRSRRSNGKRGRPKGGNLRDVNGNFTPSKMKDLYRRVARMKAEGEKNTDIAEELQVSEQTVGYIVRSPLIRAHIDRLHKIAEVDSVNMQREIAEMSPSALATIGEIMLDGEERNRLRAAETILDRNPDTSKHSKSDVTTKRVSEEQIASWKSEAIQRAQASGILAEAEIITENEEQEDAQ